MKILPFRGVYPNTNLITSAESFFADVKEEFSSFFASGMFNKSSAPSIYIYQIKTPQRSFTGIISINDIQDFIDEKILKHEQTLNTKGQVTTNLILQRKALIKPVLLAYDPVPQLDDLIRYHMRAKDVLYAITFEKSQETHSFWEISAEKEIKEFQRLFDQKVAKAYIADGHHRCETVLKLYRSSDQYQINLSGILSVYFSFDQLAIHDYNRIVDVFSEMSPLQFFARLSKYFVIRPIKGYRKPKEKHIIVLGTGDEWFELEWRKKVLKEQPNKLALLDSGLLNEYVLGEILQIEDITADEKIKYIEGTTDEITIHRMLLKNKNLVLFMLYPVQPSELKHMADKGLTLPPKSTYFEPRIKNAIIVKDMTKIPSAKP